MGVDRVSQDKTGSELRSVSPSFITWKVARWVVPTVGLTGERWAGEKAASMADQKALLD